MKQPVSVKQIILIILICISLPLGVLLNFALLDHWRVEKNFYALMSILNNARFDAFNRNIEVTVSFDGTEVVSTNSLGEEPIINTLPTIHRVDYNTTLGDNMVVFGHMGTTDRFNKRIHGGEIMLKSFFGFTKYIHVNCVGYVREGRYPED